MGDRLLGFAFGALHAAVLLWTLVALLVWGGGTAALANVGTGPGVALGSWLAIVSWAATSWSLRGATLAIPSRGDLVERAGRGGAGAGAAFVVGALLGAQVWTRAFEPALLVVAVFGAFFAGAFGALLALALASIEALYVAARRLITASSA